MPCSENIGETIHDEKMLDRRHYCGGYREYWENVKGCEGNVGDIEIHFVDTVVPGYFWLFPVSKNITNVGIGMVMSLMDKQGKKLKALQKDVIQNHLILPIDLRMQNLSKGLVKDGSYHSVAQERSLICNQEEWLEIISGWLAMLLA